MIIVLMGPAGAGKSTVGRALARSLRWPFHDADDLHPRVNVEKMARGVPLTDDDRRPWLARVRELMVGVAGSHGDAILACSALRESYRRKLAEGIDTVHFVVLDADRALLESRLAERRHHFAGAAILDGQLADLEVPAQALIVSAAQPVNVIVRRIRSAFCLPCGTDSDPGP